MKTALLKIWDGMSPHMKALLCVVMAFVCIALAFLIYWEILEQLTWVFQMFGASSPKLAAAITQFVLLQGVVLYCLFRSVFVATKNKRST